MGWMCVKMNEDIVADLVAVLEICEIKSDFTAEIQPRKMDKGSEFVFVGIVWKNKTCLTLLHKWKIVLQDVCIRKT